MTARGVVLVVDDRLNRPRVLGHLPKPVDLQRLLEALGWDPDTAP